MAARVAINGFGRIGRMVLRALYESGRSDLQVVAINDLGRPEDNIHLLRYDSLHGRFAGDISLTTKGFTLAPAPGSKENSVEITNLAIPDPLELPWKAMAVDIVLECSGRLTTRENAAAHLTAGAKRVLISAPADQADLTVVYGVNEKRLTPEHLVVSNASCTTNCLAPLAAIVDQTVGVASGFMTTIHSYTGDQPTLDRLHKDPYRARAAALNMIPTSTGAARAVGLVLPQLAGKLDGVAIRVPTPNVSVVDVTFSTRQKTTGEKINQAFQEAAAKTQNTILGVCHEACVSMDFNHDPRSSVVHLDQTRVVEDDQGNCLLRLLAWYDNEWGFSNRMVDTAAAMTRLL